MSDDADVMGEKNERVSPERGETCTEERCS